MKTPEPRPVVVGVDGSPSSLVAVDYAAAFATRRHAPLHLVHGYQRPMYSYDIVGLPLPAEPTESKIREQVQVLLGDLVEGLREEHPDLPSVRAWQANSGPATMLIDQSRHAEAVIVGNRGLGGFSELLLGSVSAQVSAYAHGPVIVVRPPVSDDMALPGPEQPRHQTPLGPILVGFDGSPAADAALDFAITEATLRKVPVTVANIYQDHPELSEDLLTAAVIPWTAKYPQLSIEIAAVRGRRPHHTLIDLSHDAALTVVGCRGRGGFAGLLLGSVSRALVHHAHGPVAVIHPAYQESEES